MRRFCSLLILAAILLGAGPAHAQPNRRIALLVGNAAYVHAGALPEAPRNVALLAAAFRRAGFSSVTTTTDASRKAMIDGLRDFAAAAETADIAVIYFSGLGVQTDTGNYLLPIEADGRFVEDVAESGVSLERFTTAAAGARKLGLVLVDAAQRDAYLMRIPRKRSREIRFGLARVEPGSPNLLVGFSDKPGTMTSADSGDGGLYAQTLAATLFRPRADIRRALRRTHDIVLARTAGSQEPATFGSLGGGAIPLGK